jgi:hypothetical protein
MLLNLLRGRKMSESKSRVIAAIGLLTDVTRADLFGVSQQPIAKRRSRALLEHIMKMLMAPEKKNHWALIESIVVFDEVAYDHLAFKRYKMTLEQPSRVFALEDHGLVAKSWPLEVYTRTSETISKWKKATGGAGLAEAARAIARDPSRSYGQDNDAFWDGAEKDYHDGLAEDDQRARWSFADSTQSIERALFYAELSQTLGVGLLPRAQSDECAAGSETVLDDLARSYSACIHHHHVQKHLKGFADRIQPLKFAVSAPPLAQKIAWLSLQQGRTPADIAAEMRDTPLAQAYRRHLADLQLELIATQPSSSEALPKLMRDFKAVADQWAREGVPKAGILYRSRTLSAHLLPAVAGIVMYLHSGDWKDAVDAGAGVEYFLVKNLPRSSMTVHDPILWGGPKYLAFVADWFDYGKTL